MKFAERVRFEVRDWQRCRAYHRSQKKHAKPPVNALVIQRTELPRPVLWSLAGGSIVLMYILIFGGIL